MTETAKELLRKTKVIRDNFYPEPVEPDHDDELKITFKFLSEVINYLENNTGEKMIEKLQEQLNSKVKVLTEIRENIEEHNQIYDLSVDTALLLEGIDGIALEAIGENHD
ncbi:MULTISPECIES: hypothetical protein [unclassified Lactococcus]|uniref:hypothetical protein n=1 Tax=unclassified Lactococcus TaxID=2643510 RepID=UPI001431C06F|nr:MULTISPECIES: hypothetical protein [unclassified Lactococcus]KAF6609749.1 hypothetical protein HFD74_05165 [Lactococcus sp. EKM201L]KAF6612469.1 hypothetical protein HFD15_05735 [Lactococcus sp. EKM203L]KAF6642957.1 hypothetical protein HFC73_02550 [Lactococcus sp. EKM501L]KAF6646504.1 hypothetical protein HFC72_02560 [Lactococcus sp. EKM502L]KAF6652555.1 hypothetical protein HFC74_05160 [Lactococcus sp. EKM101L]